MYSSLCTLGHHGLTVPSTSESTFNSPVDAAISALRIGQDIWTELVSVLPIMKVINCGDPPPDFHFQLLVDAYARLERDLLDRLAV